MNKSRPKLLPRSSAVYILGALIPFTDPNLKLTFKPSLFFKDLAEISQKKQRTIQNEFYKLKQQAYFTYEKSSGSISITDLGLLELQRFKPEYMGDRSTLMVIFDIPENERRKRTALRTTLKELRFKQIQKSVWVSRYESRKYLKAEIERLNVSRYVQVYESKKLL